MKIDRPINRPKYCDGCAGCFSGGMINSDGHCPCSNCLVKTMCTYPCGEILNYRDEIRIQEELEDYEK
jgi:hypothetical protein